MVKKYFSGRKVITIHYTVRFPVYNFDIQVPQPLNAKLNLKIDLLGGRLVLKFFLYWLAKIIACENPPKYPMMVNSAFFSIVQLFFISVRLAQIKPFFKEFSN
jgi:hypothetical protein